MTTPDFTPRDPSLVLTPVELEWGMGVPDPTYAYDHLLPDPATGPLVLRALMIEQLMRTLDDEVLIIPFLSLAPRSDAAWVALGKLLGRAHLPLTGGSPLVAFLEGSAYNPAWRAALPQPENSLWQVLEFHELLYGAPSPASDPYTALEELRRRAAELG